MGGGTKLSDDELPSVSDELSSSSSSQLDSSSVPSTYSPSSRELVAYLDLLQSYYRPPDRSADLRPLKNSIARHKPGDWIDHVGGMTLYDYDIPSPPSFSWWGPGARGRARWSTGSLGFSATSFSRRTPRKSPIICRRLMGPAFCKSIWF
ncbi:uncharacterized protein M6B38_190690 [Iris pallida]|uniref:Uncharacterized protein n=1 Tax=Iris pallida TaxID=29817 RepID=A0AAX6EFQ6_IRIPA|nr:uncharacterized protein M6B38_190690 [Iris pallida]